MSSRKIQDIVNRFTAELVAASEEEAMHTIEGRLRGVFGSSVKELVHVKQASPVKRRKTTKGYTALRPCPVAGCTEVAAPRWGLVCKAHSEALSREEVLMARDNAKKPGGAWADLDFGRKSA